MKRILHVVGIMNLGGQETLIMNIFRRINREEFQFDFVVQRKDKGYYDDEILKLGGNIYVIDPISKNPLKHLWQLSKIIKNNNYCAIHRHTNSSIVFLDVIVAKINKIKNIIVHCHSTKTNVNNFFHFVFRPVLNFFNIQRVACSKDAGIFMFNKKKFTIINNGIEIDKYLYNEKTRNSIRKKLGITNCYVIGHVGRFNDEKNHEFIIDLFQKLRDNDKTEYKLLLIGDGENRKKIQKMVLNKGIKNEVVFLGNVNNVFEYLQAMDLFIFPSKYEGLGISLIEAQASGLYCIVSDTIPCDAIVTKNVKMVPLEDTNKWIKQIIKNKNENTSSSSRLIKKNSLLQKFDINKTVSDICKLYKGENK